jgi:hypothetical protein
MSAPYAYDTLTDPHKRERVSFRVRDAQDNRIGTCYLEDHARLIVAALNGFQATAAVEWTCGHVAGMVCAECYTELSRRANALAAQILDTIAPISGAEIKTALEKIKELAANPRSADQYDRWVTALQLIEREADAALNLLPHA